MTDKRSERMLEELVKLPGNNYCADCHSPSPRWASVNLGITLCVSCASIHRKLGTHNSRVKSITLDTWSREHIASLRNIGNKASNAIYNPDETKFPPPTSSAIDERDSEMEKYIRKKYELGAFKAGAAGGGGGGGVTSRDRYRAANGLDSGAGPSSRTRNEDPWARENKRNPELNTLVVKKERDLPPLPPSAPPSASANRAEGSRERPRPSVSPSPDPMAWASARQAKPLVDISSNTATSASTSYTHAAAGVNRQGNAQVIFPPQYQQLQQAPPQPAGPPNNSFPPPLATHLPPPLNGNGQLPPGMQQIPGTNPPEYIRRSFGPNPFGNPPNMFQPPVMGGSLPFMGRPAIPPFLNGNGMGMGPGPGNPFMQQPPQHGPGMFNQPQYDYGYGNGYGQQHGQGQAQGWGY